MRQAWSGLFQWLNGHCVAGMVRLDCVAMQTVASDFCRGHVLAVDDCATTRELVRAALERLGYRVQLADCGLSALQAVDRDSFDAIVLDVEMPGLDGLAVGRALRNHPRAGAAMIAMHTSLDEGQVRAGFSRYDVFVPKSSGPWALSERVDLMVQGRRLP